MDADVDRLGRMRRLAHGAAMFAWCVVEDLADLALSLHDRFTGFDAEHERREFVAAHRDIYTYE